MLSRAHILIERDFEKLQDENIWGIEAHPLKDDCIFEWCAKIHGLQDSEWEGGVFLLYLKFDEHYSHRPPEVSFHTIPFHPNIDMITGRPCVEFLDDDSKWHKSYSVATILVTLQSLLSNPVIENAINLEATNLMLYSPHTYKQMIQECVAASQRVNEGIMSQIQDPSHVRFASHANEEPAPGVKSPRCILLRSAKVSFEDYHSTWSGIATSKTAVNSTNPLLESIKEQPTLQAAHYNLPTEDLQAQMQRQVEEHNMLLYGNFSGKVKQNVEEAKEAKLEKVNKMRKIYLQPRGPNKRTIPLDDDVLDSHRRPGAMGDNDEPWEQEVDDLVAWTSKLDEEML